MLLLKSLLSRHATRLISAQSALETVEAEASEQRGSLKHGMMDALLQHSFKGRSMAQMSDAIKAELQEKDEEIDRLESARAEVLSKMQRRRRELQSGLAVENSSIEQLESECQELEANLSAVCAELPTTLAATDDYESQASAGEGREGDLKNQLDAERLARHAAEQACVDAEARAVALAAEAEAADAAVASYKLQHQQKQDAIKSGFVEEITDHAIKLKASEIKLEAVRRAMVDREDELESMRAALEDAGQEVLAQRHVGSQCRYCRSAAPLRATFVGVSIVQERGCQHFITAPECPRSSRTRSRT